MSWSEASTCQKNKQTAEANTECPVACLPSPVSGYPKPENPITLILLILLTNPWYLLSIAAAWRQIALWQSKYKWEIEYIFVHSIYRFIRRQTKIADSFEPAFFRVRAYTKRLLKLAKHLPKFHSFCNLFFLSFAFHARIERHFCKLLTAVELGAAGKRGRGWFEHKRYKTNLSSLIRCQNYFSMFVD